MAGTKRFELVALRWDEIHSKPGEPLNYTRHTQGDLVDLGEADAKRLRKAGAVVEPGSRERAAAEALLAQAQAALAALPQEVRDQVTGIAQADAKPVDGRPVASAPKPEWVEWAMASQGMTKEDAEALTKPQLVALGVED